jgi:hypothetical protein
VPYISNFKSFCFHQAIQRPGEAILTRPWGPHFGFNSGPNLNIAINFTDETWITREAPWQMPCICPEHAYDSVRLPTSAFFWRICEEHRTIKKFHTWLDNKLPLEDTTHPFYDADKPTFIPCRDTNADFHALRKALKEAPAESPMQGILLNRKFKKRMEKAEDVNTFSSLSS